jgi:penicillin-binding protein 1B
MERAFRHSGPSTCRSAIARAGSSYNDASRHVANGSIGVTRFGTILAVGPQVTMRPAGDRSRLLRDEGACSSAVPLGAILSLAACAGMGIAAAETVEATQRAWAGTDELVGFDTLEVAVPSRIYSQGLRVAAGGATTASDLAAYLDALGYRAVPGDPPGPATFVSEADRVRIHTRPYEIGPLAAPAAGIEVVFDAAGVRSVHVDGREAADVRLEPVELATLYGSERNEHRPVTLSRVPGHVRLAVLAAEDEDFFQHSGVSPAGVLRAVWINARDGKVRQGGSTITQQLVRTVYLSSERSYRRKLRESLLAISLEHRYGKERILESYLNRMYWGTRSGTHLYGIGAAARIGFGKDVSELSVAEGASLAGTLCSPARYAPWRSERSSVARRDRVLRRMHALGWIDRDELGRALAEPLRIAPAPRDRPHAPYFVDAMRVEAAKRYDLDRERLARGGYTLLSTLDWLEQRAAERVTGRELDRLERRAKRSGLQAALISVDPRSGAVRAYQGGRDYAASQFDRVRRAHRQLGSAFKPFVFAAAFAAGAILPSTLVLDAPIEVRYEDTTWQPENYEEDYQGSVTVRRAVEQSLNTAAVRLAVMTGVRTVIDRTQGLGLPVEAVAGPAVALGAVDASTAELATAYATLASGGVRPALHGLVLVLDGNGREVPGLALLPQRVLDPATAWVTNDVLRGVLDRGTAAGARALGVRDGLAGKTGTSNEGRDAWFAGYSPDRTTVVWVGRDDHAPTGLTGASGALPIWAAFVRAVRPPGGFEPFPRPPELVPVLIDPSTGGLATPSCPTQEIEYLPPQYYAPVVACAAHPVQWGDVEAVETVDASWGALPALDPTAAEGPRTLREVFVLDGPLGRAVSASFELTLDASALPAATAAQR